MSRIAMTLVARLRGLTADKVGSQRFIVRSAKHAIWHHHDRVGIGQDSDPRHSFANLRMRRGEA